MSWNSLTENDARRHERSPTSMMIQMDISFRGSFKIINFMKTYNHGSLAFFHYELLLLGINFKYSTVSLSRVKSQFNYPVPVTDGWGFRSNRITWEMETSLLVMSTNTHGNECILSIKRNCEYPTRTTQKQEYEIRSNRVENVHKFTIMLLPVKCSDTHGIQFDLFDWI